MPGLRFTTARDLFETFPTAEDDINAEPTDEPSLDYAKALVDAGAPNKAVSFCAYLLPRREAVWWAHECVSNAKAERTAPERDALRAAQAWVGEPEEQQRLAALQKGVEGSRKSPCTWVALGAGWAGGSIMPGVPGSPLNPPYQTARAVRAAVLVAGAELHPAGRNAQLSIWVEGALRLAEHGL